jgi:hypothetical protein
MEKDIQPSEDDQIDYLAEILVEVYLESKGYKQYGNYDTTTWSRIC